jgi:hypothetical protein
MVLGHPGQGLWAEQVNNNTLWANPTISVTAAAAALEELRSKGYATAKDNQQRGTCSNTTVYYPTDGLSIFVDFSPAEDQDTESAPEDN